MRGRERDQAAIRRGVGGGALLSDDLGPNEGTLIRVGDTWLDVRSSLERVSWRLHRQAKALEEAGNDFDAASLKSHSTNLRKLWEEGLAPRAVKVGLDAYPRGLAAYYREMAEALEAERVVREKSD
jgi:hypothetical protein